MNNKQVSSESQASDPSHDKAVVKTSTDLSFRALGLDETLCKAVERLGYTNPTPIQVQSIPIVLSGRDILGCAQTGTGKTAAFALPILATLSKLNNPDRRTKALILAPTRELASQIRESFLEYGRHLGLQSAVIFGGVKADPQKRALQRGCDILVATPGRLLDLHQQKYVDLRSVSILVLDEADHMFDMGFIHDVKRIIKLVPKDRQTLLFSATMPDEIKNLAEAVLRDPARVSVTPVASANAQVEQRLYFVDRSKKRDLLVHLINEEKMRRSLVFTRTKITANRVVEFLSKHGIRAEAIHGNKSQAARERALSNFKKGTTPILVASDIAARGIDVDQISHVINYDVPNVPETYVHRIGRTGRASAVGKAISFVDGEEKAFIKSIEKLIKQKIDVAEEHPYAAVKGATSIKQSRPLGRR